MAFLKKRNLCLLVDQPSSPDHSQTIPQGDTVRRLHSILQCFLQEKEQYESALSCERQHTKMTYEGSLHQKIQQVTELTKTITELQSMLRQSRSQTQSLKVELYEKDSEIRELKRKLENASIRNMLQQHDGHFTLHTYNESNQQNTQQNLAQHLAQTMRQGKGGLGMHNIQPKRALAEMVLSLNSASLGNTLNYRKGSISSYKLVKKPQSGKNITAPGKENVRQQEPKKIKRKGITHEKIPNWPSRSSLPSGSSSHHSNKTKKSADAPPFRQCIRSSLKILKKLSVV